MNSKGNFTIYSVVDGHAGILGGYPGDTDDEALDAYAKDSGYKDFAELKAKTGKSRDDFKAVKTE